jgi:uncharacterized delta-60 repeat protein
MKIIKVIIFFTFLSNLASNAQVGLIDPNFNLGTGFGPDQWTGKCESIVQQTDGKLLIGGHFRTFNGDTSLYITRLNLDGSRDKSFNSPFKEIRNNIVSEIAIQDNGKILIGGVFTKIGNLDKNRIARLNQDGSLDQTFNTASGFNQEVTTLAIQPDGKILVGGLFTEYDFEFGGRKISANGLIRLNENGTHDSTFQVGTGFTGSSGIGQRQIHQILVQPDGKIIVAGHFSAYNGSTRYLLVRLNSNGSLDNTFNADENFSKGLDGFYGQIYTLKLLSDGKIYIGGNYGNTNSKAFGIARLNSDGSLDNSFKVSHANERRNFALDLQLDGKVIAASVNFGSPSEAFIVERYLPNGDLDTSFSPKFLNNDVTDLLVQKDGNITFVGYFNYNPTGIMRLIGDKVSSSIVKAYVTNSEWIPYPNPATDYLKVEGLKLNSEIRLTDLLGAELYYTKVANDTIILDVSEFKRGVYLLQTSFEGNVLVKKILLQ